MPAKDWHKVVHAIKSYPTSSRYGSLMCGALYVGRYAKKAGWGNVRKGVLLTTPTKDTITCIGCLAAEET